MPRRISYAQNGEDVRIWHAFGPATAQQPDGPLTYVEVGANEPREMSLSAALYDLGWRGLLIEADPELADRLRAYRPGDVVMNAAASDAEANLIFYRVPGTGLGTLDEQEADSARERGFDVVTTTVAARRLDDMLEEFLQQVGATDIHALSIDVEGAEAQVLAGLSLTRFRPWVICIEAVEPGTNSPSHAQWERHLLDHQYREVAFDGVNRWYVADEKADQPISQDAGAAQGMTIAEAIAMPFNILDAGHYGWISHESVRLHETSNRAFNRSAWQRELILNQAKQQVPSTEYERQIEELRSALIDVQGSRTYTLSRQAARAAKKVLHVAQRGKAALPAPAANRVVRERHLKHVTVNMDHLTDSAFLGEAPPDTVDWVVTHDEQTQQTRPSLPPGLNLTSLTTDHAAAVRVWLDSNPFDTDEQLDSRMDNQDDEVGRVQAALRTRLRLANTNAGDRPNAMGSQVAFDARALQSPAFGTRGIGRFAKSLLDGVRQAVPDERITLVIDPGLHPLPADLIGACETTNRVRPEDASRFGALIQPSPMTHSPEPLVPLLVSNVYKAAVVFDFIPLHYPSIYLRHMAPRAEYVADLDALAHYTDFLAISHTVAEELTTVLQDFGRQSATVDVQVAWPKDVFAGGLPSRNIDKTGPIVLMTGDDGRKNTFGGLAGIAAATSDETQRDVVVIGMAGQETRVHHWSIAAAMRPGEARTLGRVSDAELAELLASASCVVVPSFDEGLSLPVIEALRAGVPVVASEIPAHRELIGSGAFSCVPRSPRSIAQAVRKARGNATIRAHQASQISRHRHETLEDSIAASITQHLPGATTNGNRQTQPTSAPRDRLSVGIATPWPPQRSGVADYSQAVFTELTALADVTVYTTANGLTSNTSDVTLRSVSEVFDAPQEVQQRHDAFISVVGNSHY
ncbi:MAG TPA: FkbM family methyltransferase, partial [Acidimicrobiia bacterium]